MTTRCQHFKTLHVNWTCVQCVRRSVELHTTTPFTIALATTEFWLLMKIIAPMFVKVLKS